MIKRQWLIKLIFVSLISFNVLLFPQQTVEFPQELTGGQLYEEGLKLYEQEKYQEALPCFQEAAKRKANFSEAYYHLGLCHIKLVNSEQAKQNLIMAKILSNDAAFKNKTTELIEKLPQEIVREKSIQEEKQKIRLNKKALYEKGVESFEAGKYQQAHKYFIDSAEGEQGLKDGYYHAALCFVRLLDVENAKKYLSLARKHIKDEVIQNNSVALLEEMESGKMRQENEKKEKEMIERTERKIKQEWEPLKNKTLYEAIRKNDIEDVRRHIERGANIQKQRERKGVRSPLYVACESNRIEIAELLIEQGADINDGGGYAPLLMAIEIGKREIVKLLIEKGANVNAEYNEETPLFLVARKNDTEIAELLIEKGANVNAKTDKWGWTSLHRATERGNYEMVELLIEKGANVNARLTSSGETPLDSAAGRGFIEIAELLIEQGANIQGGALNSAIFNNHIDMVKLLIEKGVNVNVKFRNGKTPLHTACERSHVAIVRLLIDEGAKVNAIDNFNTSPLHAYIERLMHNRQATVDVELVKLLIENGADVNAKWRDGLTPLHLASSIGSTELVKLLIENGADVNAKFKEKTPLQLTPGIYTDVIYLLRRHDSKEY